MARTPVHVSSKSIKKSENSALSAALMGLGLEKHLAQPKPDKPKKRKNSSVTSAEQPNTTATTKKKRQGVSTAPIFKSLDTALPVCHWDQQSLKMDVPGGRILTYNELYSILQYRKHEAFRYKKICRGVIQRALNTPSTTPKPFFDGPTRLTLLRIGTKEMDLDALPIVFKYFLDCFKSEGVIADDNPNIIVDIQLIQGKGEPRLGMKLERIDDWVKPTIPSQSEWLTSTKKDG